MRLYNLIEEARESAPKENWVEELDIKKAAEWIAANAPKAFELLGNESKKCTPIFRTVRWFDKSYGLVKPSLHERTSRIGGKLGAKNNFLNLALSNLPNWKKFQNRSKSVICYAGSGEYVEELYGKNSYIVIPKDGAVVTNAYKEDIWQHKLLIPKYLERAKVTIYPSFEDFPEYFSYLVDGWDTAGSIVTYSDMLKFISAFSARIDKKLSIAQSQKLLQSMLDTGKTKNNIYPSAIKNYVECWTESDCMYIKCANSAFNNLAKAVENYSKGV